MGWTFDSSTDRLQITDDLFDFRGASNAANWTVDFHARFNSFSAYDELFGLHAEDGRYEFWANDDNRRAYVEIDSGEGTINGDSSQVVTDTWYRFTFVKEGNTRRWYRDSVLIASASSMTGGSVTTPTKLEFGGWNTNSHALDGDMAGIIIWTTALTDQEIEDQAGCSDPQVQLGSVWGVWNTAIVDDTTDYIVDSSGNGHNLIAIGMTASATDPDIVTCTETNTDLTLSSIASDEAFGTILANANLTPTSITTGEVFGTIEINAGITLGSINSALAFGTIETGYSIITSSIASAEAFGTIRIQLAGEYIPAPAKRTIQLIAKSRLTRLRNRDRTGEA